MTTILAATMALCLKVLNFHPANLGSSRSGNQYESLLALKTAFDQNCYLTAGSPILHVAGTSKLSL